MGSRSDGRLGGRLWCGLVLFGENRKCHAVSLGPVVHPVQLRRFWAAFVPCSAIIAVCTKDAPSPCSRSVARSPVTGTGEEAGYFGSNSEPGTTSERQCAPACKARQCGGFGFAVNSTTNTVPDEARPDIAGRSAIRTTAPCCCAISRTIARPRPEPSIFSPPGAPPSTR